jgi:hypothetical protein
LVSVGARPIKAVVFAVVASGILGLGIGLAVTSGPASGTAASNTGHVDVRQSPAAGAIPKTTAVTTTRAAPTSTTLPDATSLPAATFVRAPRTAGAGDGPLSATLSASPGGAVVGSTVSFVVSVTDGAATGTVGPANLTYGDGQPAPETGLAASCHAGAPPTPVAESFDYAHAYDAPGTYTVAVTVSAPCSAEQVVVTLPITVSA